jgi:predicted nucleotidyltransferase
MNLYKKAVAVVETRKRNDIINKLSLYFDFSICEGICLSGSMVYGKNNSVKKDSDIDLFLVVKAENIFKIKQYPFFTSVHYDDHTLELFSKQVVNCFWFDVFVNGIMLNIVVFEYEYFKNFVILRRRCYCEQN